MSYCRQRHKSTPGGKPATGMSTYDIGPAGSRVSSSVGTRTHMCDIHASVTTQQAKLSRFLRIGAQVFQLLSLVSCVFAMMARVPQESPISYASAHGCGLRLEGGDIRHPVHEHDHILDAPEGLEAPRLLVVVSRHVHRLREGHVLRLRTTKEQQTLFRVKIYKNSAVPTATTTSYHAG